MRALRRADAEQRDEAGAEGRRITRLETSVLEAPSYSGLESGLHPEARGRCGGLGFVYRVITIPAAQAIHWSRQIAQKEGFFCRLSAGARSPARSEVCADAPKGSSIRACSLTRASATLAHRSLRTFGGDDGGGGGNRVADGRAGDLKGPLILSDYGVMT